MKIGPHILDNNLFLAPMAGVTDLPFRRLCKSMGAGVVVGEMVSSDPSLRQSRKSQLRLRHDGEPGLRIVQIAGGDAEMLAAAAEYNVQNGAEVIDINMGCPAKKVCKKAAGSALMKDPELVDEILNAVVAAVDVPVTLKIRTGWDPENKNALLIAKLAENAGIQSLAVHGRTRACKYFGEAEYETIKLVKEAVSIPVIANGDIDSPHKARQVLEYTGADGLMIGRAAQGRPWIFRETLHFLETGELLPEIHLDEVEHVLLSHVAALHEFYGEIQGVRIARKHVTWYVTNDEHLANHQDEKNFRQLFNQIQSAEKQLSVLAEYFKQRKIEKAQVA
ncbi:tRNA dihydrouridine synthase DusB [Aliikangiella marina]|uniref:tRNA-dihydrouridine synthase B n=1 Tax=Aliikangiella marina TaxID=1712262 RepID=A0A545T574_9GAMM|nr:tRNA dihydrouridine synthase DusB [Aliikangiella marina]TQV72400.1 tRNA dihydrouridine synthase DusB [Aliikangiella marina]